MIASKSKNRGFTIIEILIVIVVIAILAAITIVSYNGIQLRAKTEKGHTTAVTIVEKAQLYAAKHGGAYPSSYDMANLATTDAAYASGTNSMLYSGTADSLTAESAQNGDVVLWAQSSYHFCGQPGVIVSAYVVYWDYTSNQQIAVPITSNAPSGPQGTGPVDHSGVSACN